MECSNSGNDKVRFPWHSIFSSDGPFLWCVTPDAICDATIKRDVRQKIKFFSEIEKVVLNFSLLAVCKWPPRILGNGFKSKSYSASHWGSGIRTSTVIVTPFHDSPSALAHFPYQLTNPYSLSLYKWVDRSIVVFVPVYLPGTLPSSLLTICFDSLFVHTWYRQNGKRDHRVLLNFVMIHDIRYYHIKFLNLYQVIRKTVEVRSYVAGGPRVFVVPPLNKNEKYLNFEHTIFRKLRLKNYQGTEMINFVLNKD